MHYVAVDIYKYLRCSGYIQIFTLQWIYTNIYVAVDIYKYLRFDVNISICKYRSNVFNLFHLSFISCFTLFVNLSLTILFTLPHNIFY